jgi:hypothetical protein
MIYISIQPKIQYLLLYNQNEDMGIMILQIQPNRNWHKWRLLVSMSKDFHNSITKNNRKG